MRTHSALLALCALGGCATPAPTGVRTYAPEDVIAASSELEGREILVHGWLGGCDSAGERACGLYSSRSAAVGPEPEEWPLLVDPGAVPDPWRVRQVIARGTYVITCRNSETSICPDYDGYFDIASIED